MKCEKRVAQLCRDGGGDAAAAGWKGWHALMSSQTHTYTHSTYIKTHKMMRLRKGKDKTAKTHFKYFQILMLFHYNLHTHTTLSHKKKKKKKKRQ